MAVARGVAFDISVVDEASQVTEPASLVAILQVLPNQIKFVWGHASVKERGTGCYAVTSGMEDVFYYGFFLVRIGVVDGLDSVTIGQVLEMS